MVEKAIAEKESKKPEWIKLSAKELESLIIDLVKNGNSPAKIGLILRDQHGIPNVKSVLNKRLLKVIKEHKLKYPTEKEFMQNDIDTLKVHIKKNKHDYPASRSLTKKLWALGRAAS
jgi:small subunit ribosomal protein S15